MPITALSTPPSRSDPANFASRSDTFFAELPVFADEATDLETNVNAKEASAVAAAATATTQAGLASTSASNASTSASTATTQAGIATTQAGIATTQASNALASANAAAASAAVINLTAPGPIGSTTPSTGAFTTLSTTGFASFNDAAIFNNGKRTYWYEPGTTTWFSAYSPSAGLLNFNKQSGDATVFQISTAGATVAGTLSATGKITQGSTAGFEINNGAVLGEFKYSGGLVINRVAGSTLLVQQNGNLEATIDASGNLTLASGSMTIGSFTTATKPAHAAGKMIYVSDGGGGAVFQGSNGSAWVNLG